MIPKKIHYCWFGGKDKPELSRRCIESWKKYAPDFEIIEWNESNFDYERYPFAKYCYETKKWAFLTDLVRLIILYDEGGWYFDTDVELRKPLSDYLGYEAVYGFQDDKLVNTGQGFGAEVRHPSVHAMLDVYLNLQKNEDGEFPIKACPILNTEALMPFGLVLNGKRQSLGSIEVLPAEYMNPLDDRTGVLNVTERTISIHWYAKSWFSRKRKLRNKITRIIHRYLGNDFLAFLRSNKE